MTTRQISLTPILLLASLSLFWGLNWPGMKIILSEMTVWWFRGSCLIAGGSILLLISALSGNRWSIRLSEIVPVITCGTFAILGWMVFSAYGVTLLPAGRAAIIAFTMPLWATLFAAALLGEPITKTKIAGLALGILGLGVLIGPDVFVFRRAPAGAVFMLLAALSWAFGTVLFKRGRWKIPVITNVAWQLLFSAVPVLFIAVITEPLPEVANFSTRALLALGYIYLFPMSFCQWAYFKTVNLLPASVAAIGTLLVPVVGVYSGHLVLGETVGIAEFVALGCVLAALALVLVVPARQAEMS